MKKPFQLLVLVATTATFFIIAYFAVSYNKKQNEKSQDIKNIQESRQINQQFIEKLASWGTMTKEEATHHIKIQESTEKLSDSDLDFVLMLLNTPPMENFTRRSIRRTEATSTLIRVTEQKRIDDKQKEKIYEATVRALQEKDDSKDGEVYRYLLREARSLNDKRFIPSVLPLLNHREPKVKESAQKTLAQLGYK